MQRPGRLLDQTEPEAADRRHPAERHLVGEVVADGHGDLGVEGRGEQVRVGHAPIVVTGRADGLVRT